MITLSPDQISHIRHHAERTYPEECCGLLLGQMRSGSADRQVAETLALENAWNLQIEADLSLPDVLSQDLDRRRRYWIDPRDLLVVQRQARDRNLNIIGVYHSHTDHPAVPSECDRQLAWAEYSYIIVSVYQGRSRQLKSWCLDDNHQFQAELIKALPPDCSLGADTAICS
ncbi:MAG: M67 family metallopeptidase [Spirulinaceae cyanobacterium RM2_2_10]|nr:M67 family metallopeptidase [Leptolyngbyaceae cyanobacterium SM1_1_3]NJN04479.1 M67 family metallopeptidase [Leptolyngbyaceae cyanobacterium RM1_1_2]NJO10677.1 M67 family metallopeptidase [Leptolyngbyaceae cyanobacterium SL_1_1]NJO20156.1 M67 family metallopeptidase [Spirulinaceae cyanobacterium RM2_2_10]